MASVAGEYSAGTLRDLLIRQQRRLKLLAAITAGGNITASLPAAAMTVAVYAAIAFVKSS